MSHRVIACSSFVLLATSLWLAGCSRYTGLSKQSGESDRTGDSSDHTHGNDAGDQAHAADAETVEQLAKLSREDRIAAERQKICPVTEQPLGSMGVPPKVNVNGHEIFLCCIGCEDALKEAPEKHLAKLTK